MRLVSRMSSVLAATALVGTSLTLAVPAMAVGEPVGDDPTVSTQVTEDGEQVESPEIANPGEEAGETSEEAATEAEGVADSAAEADENPTIAEVRAMADGQKVKTEGWVTAAWPTGGLNGFVIQTAGTGGACVLDGQSDAIFVYTNHASNVAPTPAIGAYVEVEGALETYNNLRQINISPANSAATRYTVVGDTTGIDAATAISCDWPATESQRESIESMLYDPTSSDGFAVTNNYDANTFGSLGISVTGEPLWQPSDVTKDDAERLEIAEQNKANSFVLDDGATTRYAGGTAANSKLVPPYVYADGAASVGAKVQFEESVIVDYRNGAWTLNPTAPIITSATEVVTDLPVSFDYTRPAVPSVGGGDDVVVGGFNLENYFPTALGSSWASVCESYNDNAGNPISVKSCTATTANGVTVAGPRGAWTGAMLEIQTARIVKAINDLDAAALGVMELENSFKMSFGNVAKAGGSADYLVKKLNASSPNKWAYIEPTQIRQQGVAEQDVMYPGIIYQPAKVTPIANGQLTLRDQSAAGKPFSNARAPFGQAFTPNGGGEPFFLVANHFKSKSSPGSGAEADLGEGGWNASRTAQAEALAAWANGPALAQLLTNTGVAVEDVVLVGDFNAYSWEAPMQAFYAAGFTNVNLDENGKPIQASYNYSGLNGSLDHVLVSSSVGDRATGHAIWNINAPEQIGLHYSRYDATGGNFVQDIDAMGVPNRASDHDPAVVALKKGGLSAGQKNLTIFNINDFHGRIDGTLNTAGTAIDTPAVGTYDTMQFVYTLEGLRKQVGTDKSVFFSAGDNVGASLFASAVQNDQRTIDLLLTLGLRGTAVGNHEFDQGAADLVDRIVPAFGPDSPQIAANVFKADGDLLLEPFVIVEQNGLKIAMTGAVTQETPTLVSPNAVAGLEFTDPVDAVNTVIDDLMALPESERPDIIVAEYHEGASSGTPASSLAEQVASVAIFAKIVNETSAEVDAIFNGHTHQMYAWDGPVPGVPDKTRPVVSTGSYGANIGTVTLTVDDESDVVNYSAANVPTSGTATAPGFAAGVSMDKMKGQNPTSATAYSIVLAALKKARLEGDRPAGALTGTISRAFSAGEYVDGKWQKTSGSSEDRGSASPLATLVGNMLKDGTLSTIADKPNFGVANPGGLRTDLVPGANGMITVAQARSVLPFNNDLATVKMTGAQVVKMLEQQWQRDGSGAVPSRSYLQLGLSDNVQYTYHEVQDPANPGHMKGIIDSVTIDGKALDPEAQYIAGTFTFLAAGGDNFHVFKDGDVNSSYGFLDWESWLKYLAEESGCNAAMTECTTPIAPNWARQGVGVELPEGGLQVGLTASVTYRNVNIHAVGAPENTEIELTDGSTVLGTGSVVSKLTGSVWSDSATIEFVVPATDPLEMVATAAPTDTVAITRTEATPRPEVHVRRIAGANRYETNLAVNKTVPAAAGGIVIVATGADFADSLSASPAAAINDGSLFLTARGALTQTQLNEIKALDPSRVYIVGGTGAVSSNVATQLTNTTGMFPIRVSGANRYETSAKVFQTFFGALDVEEAFVATGRTFPDALSASAAAGALDAPVILVDGVQGTNLLAPTLNLLDRMGTETVVITGGTGAVSNKIKTNLEKSFDNVVRVSGADRYQTNLAVNDYVNDKVGMGSTSSVWLATGRDFPDALSAASKAGHASERLVLTNGQCIMKPVVSEWIMGQSSRVEWVNLVGGTGVLPKALEKLPECK